MSFSKYLKKKNDIEGLLYAEKKIELSDRCLF
jgi:hypothetical protein